MSAVESAPSSRNAGTHALPDYFNIYFIGSVVAFAASLLFAVLGWRKLYDNSFEARIVGGDAYNYIIYAGRGTALVCIGIVFGLIGVALAIFSLMEFLREVFKKRVF